MLLGKNEKVPYLCRAGLKMNQEAFETLWVVFKGSLETLHGDPQAKIKRCWREFETSPYTVKKALQNSDVDNGGANQPTQGSENSCSHVVWFCATVVSIGVWRVPIWLFLQCTNHGPFPSVSSDDDKLRNVSPHRYKNSFCPISVSTEVLLC